jgi:putative ABC transport system ATP-binding protein
MMDLMSDLVHSEGIAAVISTHDPMLMQRADTVIELHDGRLSAARRAHGRHAAPVDPV